jgi:hypothetical protein
MTQRGILESSIPMNFSFLVSSDVHCTYHVPLWRDGSSRKLLNFQKKDILLVLGQSGLED